MDSKHVHFSTTLSLPSSVESYIMKFKVIFGLYPVWQLSQFQKGKQLGKEPCDTL